MKKTAARWGAATLSGVILFTQVLFSPAWVQAAELDFWRARALHQQTSPTPPSIPTPVQAFPFLNGNIAGFATVHSPSNRKNHRPTIVLLQDVHHNIEAQRNIGEVLKRTHDVVIGVEAANGPFNFEPFRAFPVPSAAKNIGDYLLAENQISAVSWAGLTSEKALPATVGVDDPLLYAANVRAYQKAAPVQEEAQNKVDAALLSLEKSLNQLSPAACKLFTGQLAFHRGQTTIEDYLSSLSVNDLSAVPNIKMFRDAVELEKKLNLSQAEKERDQLLAKWAHRDPQSVNKLTQVAQAVAAGQTSPLEFYGQLNVDAKQYPALASYIRYLKSADSIDRGLLFVELAALRNRAIEEIAKTQLEKETLENLVVVLLQDKLVKFEMTPEEWAEYQAVIRRGGSQASNFFEAFYRLAESRNEKMAENLLAALVREKKQTAVLVAGGFHTAGLAPYFRQKGFDVLVVTPKFDVPTAGSGNNYLKTFLRNRTPLTRLVRGEKVTLGDVQQHLRPGMGTKAVSIFVFLAASFAAQAKLVSAQTTQYLQPIAPAVRVETYNGGAYVNWPQQGQWNVAPVRGGAVPSNGYFSNVPGIGNVRVQPVEKPSVFKSGGFYLFAVSLAVLIFALFRGPQDKEEALSNLKNNWVWGLWRSANYLYRNRTSLKGSDFLGIIQILDNRWFLWGAREALTYTLLGRRTRNLIVQQYHANADVQPAIARVMSKLRDTGVMTANEWREFKNKVGRVRLGVRVASIAPTTKWVALAAAVVGAIVGVPMVLSMAKDELPDDLFLEVFGEPKKEKATENKSTEKPQTESSALIEQPWLPAHLPHMNEDEASAMLVIFGFVKEEVHGFEPLAYIKRKMEEKRSEGGNPADEVVMAHVLGNIILVQHKKSVGGKATQEWLETELFPRIKARVTLAVGKSILNHAESYVDRLTAEKTRIITRTKPPTARLLIPFIPLLLYGQLAAKAPHQTAGPMLSIVVLILCFLPIVIAMSADSGEKQRVELTPTNYVLSDSDNHFKARLQRHLTGDAEKEFLRGDAFYVKFEKTLDFGLSQRPVTRLQLSLKKSRLCIVEAFYGDVSVFDKFPPLPQPVVTAETEIGGTDASFDDAMRDFYSPTKTGDKISTESDIAESQSAAEKPLTPDDLVENALRKYLTGLGHLSLGPRIVRGVDDKHKNNPHRLSAYISTVYVILNPQPGLTTDVQGVFLELLQAVSSEEIFGDEGALRRVDEDTKKALEEWAKNLVRERVGKERKARRDNGSSGINLKLLLWLIPTATVAAYTLRHFGYPVSPQVVLAVTGAVFLAGAIDFGRGDGGNQNDDVELAQLQILIQDILRGYGRAIPNRVALKRALQYQALYNPASSRYQINMDHPFVRDVIDRLEREYHLFAASKKALDFKDVEEFYDEVAELYWDAAFRNLLAYKQGKKVQKTVDIVSGIFPGLEPEQKREKLRNLLSLYPYQLQLLRENDHHFYLALNAMLVRYGLVEEGRDYKDKRVDLPEPHAAEMRIAGESVQYVPLVNDFHVTEGNVLIEKLLADGQFSKTLTHVIHTIKRIQITLDSNVERSKTTFTFEKSHDRAVININQIRIRINPFGNEKERYRLLHEELFLALVVADLLPKELMNDGLWKNFSKSSYVRWQALSDLLLYHLEMDSGEEMYILGSLAKERDLVLEENFKELLATKPTLADMVRTDQKDANPALEHDPERIAQRRGFVNVGTIAHRLETHIMSVVAKSVIDRWVFVRIGPLLLLVGLFTLTGANGGNILLTMKSAAIVGVIITVVAAVWNRVSPPTSTVEPKSQSDFPFELGKMAEEGLQGERNIRPSLLAEHHLVVHNIAEIRALREAAENEGDVAKLAILKKRIGLIVYQIMEANEGRGAVKLIGITNKDQLDGFLGSNQLFTDENISFSQDPAEKIGDPIKILLANRSTYSRIHVYALDDDYWRFDPADYEGVNLAHLVIEMMAWSRGVSVDISGRVQAEILARLESLRAA